MEEIELVIDSRGNEKQKKAFRILLDNDTEIRELWYWGSAGGWKTFTGVAWQWIRRQEYPGTRWFFARNELKKIKKSTYISYLEFCDRYEIPEIQRWKFNASTSEIIFNNWSVISFIDLAWQPRDPLYLRFWSELYTDWFIEESNEINALGVEMIKTRVWRWMNWKEQNWICEINPITFETFNPDKGHVYTRFYQPYKKWEETSRKKFIPALLTDNSYIPKSYIENLKNASKITRERLLYWNFEYDDTPGKMMTYDAIQNLSTNPIYNWKKYIICDPAGKWKDTATITVWQGLEIIDFFTFAISTTVQIQDKIKELAQRYKVPMRNVLVDYDGLGMWIADNLKCKWFVNNSRVVDTRTPAQKRNDEPQPNFMNLKTQCAFKMAELVEQSKINTGVLTPDHQLKLNEELDQMAEIDIDKDAKTKMTSKEDVKTNLWRSPDWSDNLLMRAFFELIPKKVAVAF